MLAREFKDPIFGFLTGGGLKASRGLGGGGCPGVVSFRLPPDGRGFETASDLRQQVCAQQGEIGGGRILQREPVGEVERQRELADTLQRIKPLHRHRK